MFVRYNLVDIFFILRNNDDLLSDEFVGYGDHGELSGLFILLDP